jgi:hypothetical protein
MRQSKVRLRGRHTLQPEALATACTEIRAYRTAAWECGFRGQHEAVLAMPRQPGSATVGQAAKAMGSAMHAAHGFYAGQKNQGITVIAAECVSLVRQPGGRQERHTIGDHTTLPSAWTAG